MSDGMIIKVDVAEGGVKQKVQDIEQTFAKLEARGPSVSAALTKGLADGSAAAERLKTATGAVVNPFDSLTAAIKREQDVLERIHGPAREYAQDLQALDALLEKNAISTSEYAEQVTRLNQAMKNKRDTESEGSNPVEGLKGGSELLTGAMAGGAAAGVIELGKHVGELIESEQRLQDIQINMANAAIRFTDALHGANDVIEEQSKLGEELHSTYGPTVELYARVKEGSDELNLSHKEQIELTKTLGEEVQLAGRPLGDASGLMSRFAFAMQSGHIETRQLSQIMREVPGIMDIWKEAFGKNVGAILSDVKAGKISVDDLVRALIEHGNVADKNFSKHQATNEALKEQWKETVALKGVYGEFFEDLNKAANGEHTFGDALRAASGAIDEQSNAIKQHATDALGTLGVIANQAHVAFSKLTADLTDVARVTGVIGNTWDQALGQHGKAMKIAMDSAGSVGEAKQQLAALDEAYKLSGGHIADYVKQRKALLDTISGGAFSAEMEAEKKVLEEIFGPEEQLQKHIEVLNALFAKGKIDIDEYKDSLSDAFFKANPNGAKEVSIEALTKPVEKNISPEDTNRKLEETVKHLREMRDELYASRQHDIFEQTQSSMKAWGKDAERMSKAMEKVFDPMVDAITQFATTGTVDIGKMADSMIADFVKVEAKALEMKAIAALTDMFTEKPTLPAGSDFSSMSGALGSLAAMFGGGAADGGYVNIPHFAGGGMLTPMRSGRDDHLLQMFVNTGERVTVQTPQQVAAAQGGQGGAASVENHNHLTFQGLDDRSIAAGMASSHGQAATYKFIRDNAGAIRAILQRG